MIWSRDRVVTFGLAFAALVVGIAFLYGGFVPSHELAIAPVAGLVVAGAFWCGLKRSRAVGPHRRLASAFTMAGTICLVLILPAGLRWAWLQREARTIPVPAGAVDVRRETNVVFWDPYVSPYSAQYITRLSFADADRFLTSGFTKNGWKVGGRYRAETYTADERPSQYIAEHFKLQARSGRLRNYVMIRDDRWMNVTLFDAGSECWVMCRTHGEPPPDSLRSLWR